MSRSAPVPPPLHTACAEAYADGESMCETCNMIVDGWKPVEPAEQSPDDIMKVTLTRKQVVTLARLARNQARKQDRRNAKSQFVPEPGRRDAGEYTADRMWGLAEYLHNLTGLEMKP